MRLVSLVALAALLAGGASVFAADNELTAEEKTEGWRLLFNGKDYNGWVTNKRDKATGQFLPIRPTCKVDENSIVPVGSGGYIVIFKEAEGKDQFGDFILKCDVKMTNPCNSGIFFRVGNPEDCVQTGFEMQVASGNRLGKHEFGAIYDAAACTKNIARQTGDPNPWNQVEIRCEGPMITVTVNGERVNEMNVDQYTTPRLSPDGTKNKYNKAIKDFPRVGYVGFQDHEDKTKAIYKNVKILELKKS